MDMRLRENGFTLARNEFLRRNRIHLFVLPFWQWSPISKSVRDPFLYKLFSSMVYVVWERYYRTTRGRLKGRATIRAKEEAARKKEMLQQSESAEAGPPTAVLNPSSVSRPD
jgi:hypothetical protein